MNRTSLIFTVGQTPAVFQTMTDYIAVDQEALDEQLRIIAEVLGEAELTEEQEQKVGDAYSEINSIKNFIGKPITISDRDGVFEITVSTDE